MVAPERLHVVIDASPTRTLLKVDSLDDDRVTVSNKPEPPFNGSYEVTSTPPPHLSQHGDYIFELVRQEEE